MAANGRHAVVDRVLLELLEIAEEGLAVADVHRSVLEVLEGFVAAQKGGAGVLHPWPCRGSNPRPRRSTPRRLHPREGAGVAKARSVTPRPWAFLVGRSDTGLRSWHGPPGSDHGTRRSEAFMPAGSVATATLSPGAGNGPSTRHAPVRHHGIGSPILPIAAPGNPGPGEATGGQDRRLVDPRSSSE